MTVITTHYFEEHRVYHNEDDPEPSMIFRKDSDDTCFTVYDGSGTKQFCKFSGDPTNPDEVREVRLNMVSRGFITVKF